MHEKPSSPLGRALPVQGCEPRADTRRQFTESREYVSQRMSDMQRQFSEAKEDTRRGFHEMREDHQRLEDKLDVHGEQMSNLRQEVGRLQDVVERTFQPERFTVAPARGGDGG